MVGRVISKKDAELYDGFVKEIQIIHAKMFRSGNADQQIMSLYMGALNMIGHIYNLNLVKDKRVMLRRFISDVRMNFKKQKSKLE